MNLPLSDLPINEQLLSLTEHCIDDKRVSMNRMGRYTIMVIPFRRVAYDASRDAPGVLTEGGYIGVIDHLTGRIGAKDYRSSERDQFLDVESGKPYPLEDTGIFGGALDNSSSHSSSSDLPIESLASAVREGDIQYVIRNAAEIFHLDEDSRMTNALARESIKSNKQGTEMEGGAVEWLINNTLSNTPKPDSEAPIGVSVLANKYEYINASVLSMRSSGVGGFSDDVKNKQKQYPVPISAQSYEQYKEESLSSSADFKVHKGPIHLVVEAEAKDDHQSARNLRARAKAITAIVETAMSSVEKATERFDNAYKSSVIERAMSFSTSVNESDLRNYVNYVIDRVGYKSDSLSMYLSGSAEAIRNKCQLLSRFKEAQATFYLLLNNEFRKAIEEGRPIKEAVSCFPLLNTSKRTINNFFSNLDLSRAMYSTDKDVFHLEKGPVERPAMVSPGSPQRTVDLVALMTTLPETSFQKKGAERSAEDMWEIIATAPNLIECLKERIRQEKEGRASMKNALTWVTPYVEDPSNNHPYTLGDVGRILYETYYQPISNHLKFHSSDNIRAELLTPESEIRDHVIVSQLASSGEYRDVIRASDQAHKMINETYRRSKPDHILEWKDCIQPYREGAIEISAISSNHDLGQEGRELDHCVGSYLTSTIRNECYILSVKVDGDRSSTIELQGDDLDDLHIVQHRAKSNSIPSDQELALGKKLLKDIKSGEVDFDFTPCHGIESRLSSLSATERKEVMDGIAFTRKDVVLGLIEDFHNIAPTLDLWQMLKENDHAINHHGVESLKESYLQEKSLEREIELS